MTTVKVSVIVRTGVQFVWIRFIGREMPMHATADELDLDMSDLGNQV